MKTILETERLRLRKFTRDDTSFIIELLNSPGWIQYIGDRNVNTEAQAVNYLQNGPLQSYRQHGFGMYLVEKKEDGTAAGMCGILKRENLEHPDIGFAFLPQFHGKGYALEIARATLVYAKTSLGIPQVWAITLADNAKSIRLLETIGLQFRKTLVFPETQEELLVYSS